MDALYRRFVGPGDLAFDIGSHVGDRIGAFRRLGARVIALEPQPDCVRVLVRPSGAGALVAGPRRTVAPCRASQPTEAARPPHRWCGRGDTLAGMPGVRQGQ